MATEEAVATEEVEATEDVAITEATDPICTPERAEGEGFEGSEGLGFRVECFAKGVRAVVWSVGSGHGLGRPRQGLAVRGLVNNEDPHVLAQMPASGI